MKKNWLKTILASGLSLAMLVGCGNGTTTTDASITVNLGSEPPELVSFLNTDSTSGNVLRHIIEGFVTLDENNNAVPGVAKEIPTKENGGISEDGKTVTFTLNPEAKWQDGTQVTAADFDFAWNELFRPSNGAQYASTWAPLIVGAEDILYAQANIEAKYVKAGKAEYVKKEDATIFTPNDDKIQKEFDAEVAKALEEAYAAKGWSASEDGTTFTVQLTGPYTYFVNLMAFYSFAPMNQKAYENGGGLDKYANDVEGFLGNGPFVLKSWTHSSELVLEKNENYWNKDAVKLQTITMKMIDDSNTALNEFENGSLDMVGLTGEQAAKLKDNGQNVVDYADGSVWYFEFNTTVKGLNNAKVRKALTYGYDVPTFIEKVLLNESLPGTTFTAPSIRGGEFSKSLGDLYNRTFDEAQYTEAKKLLEEGLAEEGLTPDQFTLTILGDNGDSPQKTYAFFQEQWEKNLGINVKIEQVEFQTRLSRMSSHDFDVVFAGWSADYDDPMSYLDIWLTGGGNNHTSWSNAEYDAAIKAALVEVDSTKRDEYLKKAEEILATEFPVGLIYNRYRSYICSDRLTGVIRNAFSDLDLTKASVK